MARTVNLGADLDRQVAIAAERAGVSGAQFIAAAVQAAIVTCAQHDVSLATAIRAAGAFPVVYAEPSAGSARTHKVAA
jgi:hypothetical protein